MIGKWHLRCALITELLGYDVDKLPMMQQQEFDGSNTIGVSSKKKRMSDSGSDWDWEYLGLSVYHQSVGQGLSTLLGLQPFEMMQQAANPPHIPQINTSATLFTSIPLALFSLHLLYEVIFAILDDITEKS